MRKTKYFTFAKIFIPKSYESVLFVIDQYFIHSKVNYCKSQLLNIT